MAWFRNHYECDRCDSEWTDEWSCMCDDDCPTCEARHMSPHQSDDLTAVVEKSGRWFLVLRSPESAEESPDYEQVASFRTLKQAKAYLLALHSFIDVDGHLP